jgi:DNA-binding NarL/FixJ family response regulator
MDQNISLLLAIPNHFARVSIHTNLIVNPFIGEIHEATTPEDLRKLLLSSTITALIIHQDLFPFLLDMPFLPFLLFVERANDINVVQAQQQPGFCGCFTNQGPAADLSLFCSFLPEMKKGMAISGNLQAEMAAMYAKHTNIQTREYETLQKVTSREREVYLLYRKGYSDDEIAEKLFIRSKTVKKHLENMAVALGVTTRELRQGILWPIDKDIVDDNVQ